VELCLYSPIHLHDVDKENVYRPLLPLRAKKKRTEGQTDTEHPTLIHTVHLFVWTFRAYRINKKIDTFRSGRTLSGTRRGVACYTEHPTLIRTVHLFVWTFRAYSINKKIDTFRSGRTLSGTRRGVAC